MRLIPPPAMRQLHKTPRGLTYLLALLRKTGRYGRPVRKGLWKSYRWLNPVVEPKTEMLIKLIEQGQGRAGGVLGPLGETLPPVLTPAQKATMRAQGLAELRELRRTILAAGAIPPAIGIAAMPAWDAIKGIGSLGLEAGKKLIPGGEEKWYEKFSAEYEEGFLQKCAEAGIDPKDLLSND